MSSSDVATQSPPFMEVVGELEDIVVKAVVTDMSTPESASPCSRLQFSTRVEALGGRCTVDRGLAVNLSERA